MHELTFNFAQDSVTIATAHWYTVLDYNSTTADSLEITEIHLLSQENDSQLRYIGLAATTVTASHLRTVLLYSTMIGSITQSAGNRGAD